MIDLSQKNIELLAIDTIECDPEQPRKQFSDEEEKLFAANLEACGQLVPIIVVLIGTKHRLVDGERRWRAAKRIGMTHLHAMVLECIPNEADLLVIQTSINCNRADLNPIDKCLAFKRLMGLLKIGTSELAARLGLSKSSVTRILSHDQLSQGDKDRLRRGEIGSAEAYQLVLAAKDKPAATQTPENERKKKRADKQPSLRRLNCELPECSLAIRASKSLSIDELIGALKELVKLCRKAKLDKIDLSTMALVLRDQTRAAKLLQGESSSSG